MSEQLPIGKVFPSEHNPRTIRENDPGIDELAESFKVHGQLQAGLVRPHPEREDAYELIAGHRRHAAAVKAGLETFKVEIIHVDDHVALEMIVTENIQREDLAPLEEARAIRSLVRDGKTIEEVALVLGKTANWIARRMKLLDLDPDLQAAAEDPTNVISLWTVGMLEDVASLPLETQARLTGHQTWDFPSTAAALEKWIKDEQRNLSSAPWALDDEMLLPAAGACVTCLKRAGAQPELFCDAVNGDRCLDMTCWREKVRAHQVRAASELRAEHPDAMIVKGSYTGRPDEIPGFDDALEYWDYSRVKKTTPGAVPALVVSGKGAGQKIWIKPNKSLAKPAEKKAAAETKSDPRAVLKAKEDALKKRRAMLAVQTFLDKLAKVKWADLTPAPTDGDLISLAAHVGARNACWGGLTKAIKKIRAKPDIAVDRETLWSEIRKTIVSNATPRDGAHAVVVMKEIIHLAMFLPLYELVKDAEAHSASTIAEPKTLIALRAELKSAKAKPKKPAQKDEAA